MPSTRLAPAAPPDPDLHGLAILVTDAGGVISEQTLPTGAYDKATKTGWKVNKKRTTWTWANPKGGAVGGFIKAVVARKRTTLAIALKAQNGAYAATAPVAIAVTLPANGECAHTDFSAPKQACVLKNKGKKIACK